MVSTVKIFNITIPQKDDLRCAICKIVNCENDRLIYSEFCTNKLKCRQFLQETSQAMAAPITNRKILEIGGSMYIIVRKEFFESCTFQDYCDTLNIQVMDLLDRIPTYIYKACLLYTMEFKLSPQWNKVGQYFVGGQNFLSSTGNVNAITLNIKEICDDNAWLHVEAVNLKIPFLKLNAAHSLHDLPPPIRVLPSMKMANVLCISKTIKNTHPFKNYDDLRVYWKNMHGYILPDYEEGFLFYDIEFYYFKSRAFVYPETCLTSGPLEILPPAMDPVPIIYKLAGDLRGRVVKLCGQQLDICPENMYQAALIAYTPALPRTSRFSGYDTGYGTQSRKINNVIPSLRMPDTCEIPTKRSRLTLSKSSDSLTCKTEVDDFDFDINSTCSTSKFKPLQITGRISATLCDIDSAMDNKPIIQKDESKSNYFKQEKQELDYKPSVELTDKEEKPDKLSLKEKLLRNF